MGLQYVVAKRIFGFDKDKNVKYVAKSVGAGELDFDKLCAKVSRILGIHRKTVDLVAAGLVDIMSEEIDDGKTVRLGDFGLFRPSFVGKSADTEAGVSISSQFILPRSTRPFSVSEKYICRLSFVPNSRFT